jgi:hypothetical protein
MSHSDDNGLLRADPIKQIVRKALKYKAPCTVIGDWKAHGRLRDP